VAFYAEPGGVQLTPARVEVRIGPKVSTGEYDAGEVFFLPRDVPPMPDPGISVTTVVRALF
jgi:hypothetical protein